MPSKQELKATEDMIFGKNRVQKSKVAKERFGDEDYVASRSQYVTEFKTCAKEQARAFDAFMHTVKKEIAIREFYGNPDLSGRLEDILRLLDEIENWGIGEGFYDEDLIAEYDDYHRQYFDD